ncbi:nucleotidyltransferase family protein [Acidithiobacillus sulfurivorans]|uniref:NTP transferase domain-containing protein n=1 Tax=Acidithiobacillus sulfurivorans TaxID=1958756 RepID=A0ABS5ZY62_9PROT|nr:nucleotidyltransferase family protein [Acidithiobacillus sulfurivorans]MBU2760150.1 NTP transferase domain-containing protein [Acidithiobacillus sulfurivorans]
MAAAVILAGGRSRRSGLLHKACRKIPGDTRSWVDRQVDRLREAGFAPVMVVTGYRPRRIHHCLHRRVSYRHHFRANCGPFSTLQRALQGLRGPLLLVQTDTVLPSLFDLRRLRRVMQGELVAAASLVNIHGRGGHPLILSASWARQLLDLFWQSKDARLDEQLRLLPSGRYIRLNSRRHHSFSGLNTQREWHSAHIRARRLP